MPRRATRPKPTLLLLVRHALTPTTGKVLPGTSPGLHLSDKGREQARATSERLAGLPALDAVYASPLERARETAAPIAALRQLKVRTERGLRDADTGDWTGRELKSVRKEPEWKLLQRHPGGFRFPGGESFVELSARVLTTLDRLRAAHPGQTVVAVSHADPIKLAVAHAMGSHLDFFQRLTISPASVSAIAYTDGMPHVLTVNAVGDLAGLGPS